MPVTAGTVLGRYRLLDKAGVGGMSEVWRAEDETLKRVVAVKVILGPVAADSTFCERFLREARLVAGLEHPNVLPVFDYGTTVVDAAEVSYLVMPLVTGGSLKGRAAGPVPPALAISWLSAIALALDHAHSKGILHRDVKPGNVLLDAQGRPLLADFGLARSAEVSSGLTATGTVLGTPLYMAPEQAMGAPLTGRADQYALAVIAFELLAGKVPFSAESPLAVLHQHVSTPPPPLSTVLPGTAANVDAVLSRGLAKKPEDRFASCSAFVAALAAALAVPGAAATVPQAMKGQSLVATIVSSPAISPAALAAPASLAKDTPEGAPKDANRAAKVLLAALLLLSAGGGVFLFLRGTGRPSASTGASAIATPEISLKVGETPAPVPAAASASTSAAAPATSEIPDSSKVAEATAAGAASAADEPTPR
ncbi:MAG: serine/threonine protein kinase, partial [Thermoanaerobaculia bacterium]|nr:serine/threonine protein kinase [Thermoanaerobaculia bacterium]